MKITEFYVIQISLFKLEMLTIKWKIGPHEMLKAFQKLSVDRSDFDKII